MGVVGFTLITVLVVAGLLLQEAGVRDDWVPVVFMFAILGALVATIAHILALVVSCLRTVQVGTD